MKEISRKFQKDITQGEYKHTWNRMGNGRLSQRIAEETQLLAEEKWIIEMLSELNRQKNTLQIERLHLEHFRAQILQGKADRNDPKQQETAEDSPSSTSGNKLLEHRVSENARLDFNGGAAGLDDDACNKEELNLSITNSVFANQDHGFDIEEEEEDMENCVIDMNMFMYGG